MSPVMFLGSGAAKAVPQFIGMQYLDYTGGSTLYYPAGAQNGDLIVVMATCTGASGTPSGFTQQSSYYWTTYGYYTYVWTKFVSGDTYTSITSLGAGACCCMCIRGASGVGGIGGYGELNSTYVTSPSFTLTNARSLTVGFVSDRDPTAGSPPGGWTGRAYWNGTYIAFCVGTIEFGATGASGAHNWGQVYAAPYAAVATSLEIIP